jgi:hypothetical protein
MVLRAAMRLSLAIIQSTKCVQSVCGVGYAACACALVLVRLCLSQISEPMCVVRGAGVDAGSAASSC